LHLLQSGSSESTRQCHINYLKPAINTTRNMSPRSDSIEPSLPSLHQTPTNITLSPELFEKLYLTPKVPHVGDAYKRFANPTPMGFVGFVISTFSFAMVMMGWGGAAGLSGVAGIFFFVGPVLLLLGTIFEWVMGNFFPVSMSFFFLSSETATGDFLLALRLREDGRVSLWSCLLATPLLLRSLHIPRRIIWFPTCTQDH
jgi:hypothetical protein